jgi:3-oxoacyl-[acyl-carrier-protein] synthase II
MPEPEKRVVITGIGIVSPIGCDVDSLWSSLQASRSGITRLESIPEGSLPVRFGAEVKSFTGDIENFGPLDKTLQRNIRKNQKVMCREIEIGVAACQLALSHSQLTAEVRHPERTGIVFGCDYLMSRPEEYADGIMACENGDDDFQLGNWPTQGLPKVNPLWLLKYLPNMPASHVAIYNDLRGPSNSLTVRDASTSLAIAEAVAIIRRGTADAMLVGSTGSNLQPLRAIHLCKQVPLASERQSPAEMSRPFNRDRDGIVLGEGAGAFVVESLESAEKRGAKIWGEICETVSSYSKPDESGEFIRKNTLSMLSKQIAKNPDLKTIRWHIHSTGSGSIEGDRAESQGIHEALGGLASRVPVVAAKSFFGHLGAGSASVEIAASCLALNYGELFPMMNCKDKSPECPISIGIAGDSAGDAFVHVAYTPQGQASSVLVRKFV